MAMLIVYNRMKINVHTKNVVMSRPINKTKQPTVGNKTKLKQQYQGNVTNSNLQDKTFKITTQNQVTLYKQDQRKKTKEYGREPRQP